MITKIVITDINADTMGYAATDADAAQYRAYVAGSLATLYPGADISVSEESSLTPLALETSDDATEWPAAMDEVSRDLDRLWEAWL